MRRLVAAVAVGLVLAACGDDPATQAPSGPDVVDVKTDLPGNARWIEVKHPLGGTVWCLYLYEAGYNEGGPALWCERPPTR